MKTLVIGICLIGGVYGQRFEVASVRVAAPRVPDPYVGPMRGGPGTPDPGSFTWEYAPPRSILTKVFGSQTFQLEGPGLDDVRYDITAKVPEGTTPDGLNAMLLNLLIDRLGLKFHHESRVMPVYELTVAKNGPKFKEWGAGSTAATGARYTNGVMHLVLAKSSIHNLAGNLGVELERIVIDKTGLTGTYDIQLDYAHDGLRPFPGVPTPAVQDAAPSLFTAVQEQLGLRLEPAKDPVDVIVIDSINKTPTPD